MNNYKTPEIRIIPLLSLDIITLSVEDGITGNGVAIDFSEF